MTETRGRAIRCISLREAWLYRDWQSGVGDTMIDQATAGGRRYDIIGFRDFELLNDQRSDRSNIWISRMEEIFEDLDTTVASRFDVRLDQLQNTLQALATLNLNLVKMTPKRSCTTKKRFSAPNRS